MTHYYWNDWYSGWGWFLWFGVFFLIFSSFGNWGYTYRAHRRFEDGYPSKEAIDILNARYARGEVTHDEYLKMKAHILSESTGVVSESVEEKRQRSRTHTNTPAFGK
jgi:putative membrane protein